MLNVETLSTFNLQYSQSNLYQNFAIYFDSISSTFHVVNLLDGTNSTLNIPKTKIFDFSQYNFALGFTTDTKESYLTVYCLTKMKGHDGRVQIPLIEGIDKVFSDGKWIFCTVLNQANKVPRGLLLQYCSQQSKLKLVSANIQLSLHNIGGNYFFTKTLPFALIFGRSTPASTASSESFDLLKFDAEEDKFLRSDRLFKNATFTLPACYFVWENRLYCRNFTLENEYEEFGMFFK